MPKVWVTERGHSHWKLIDPTDEELRDSYPSQSFGLAKEEDIVAYIREYREKEAEKLRKEAEAKLKSEAAKKKAIDPDSVEPEFKSLFSTAKPAQKDANADKRAAYSRQISEKESKIDELRDLERNFQANNERFVFDMRRPFESSEEAFHQRNQFPSPASQRQENLFQEVHTRLNSVANKQNEGLESICRESQRKMEDELEGLYAERNALSW